MKKLSDFSFALVLSWSILCRGEVTFPVSDLVDLISDKLETKCIEIVHIKNASFSIYDRIFRFFKNVVDSHLTVTFLMEDQQTMMNVEDMHLLSQCNRPLRVSIGSEETKIYYEMMSRHRDSKIMRPVSLVLMTSEINDFFRNVTLAVDLTTIAAVYESHQVLQLFDVHRIDDDFPLKVQNVGNWTPGNGSFFHLTRNHYTRRKFDRKMFRTVSPEMWPYVTFQGFMEKNMTWDGFYARVWRELESFFNFTSVHLRNNTYGTERGGNWTGMVKMILENDADVIVADLTLTSQRVHVLDFIYVLPVTRSRIYYKQIGYQVFWYALFLPLSRNVWFAVVLSCVAITACLQLFSSVRKSYGLEPGGGSTETDDYVFFTFRTFVQQAATSTDRNHSTRLVYLAGYAVATIVFSAYSAFLVSFLSKEIPRRPFHDLRGFLNDGTYKLLLERDTYNYAFFSGSKETLPLEIYRKMSRRITVTHYINSTSTGLEMICRNGKLAIVETEKMIGLMNPAALQCQLLSIDEPLQQHHDGIALRKGSQYTAFFRFYIQKMREAGMIHRLLLNVKTAKSKLKKSVKPIHLEQVYIIFLLLFFGMIVSLILLTAEIISASIKERGKIRVASESGRRQENSPQHVIYD